RCDSRCGGRDSEARPQILQPQRYRRVASDHQMERDSVQPSTLRRSRLRVPTLPEMARIKAWLLVTRNTVRDFLDTVVLFERLGEERLVEPLRSFDAIYRQSSGA